MSFQYKFGFILCIFLQYFFINTRALYITKAKQQVVEYFEPVDDFSENSTFVNVNVSEEIKPTEPHTDTSKCFMCGDGKCIPHHQRCDGEKDCPDGIDEKNCTTTPPRDNQLLPPNRTVCSGSKFMCNNKKCIPKIWRCDMDNDCGDNSDEIDCGASLTTTVPPTTRSISPKYAVCNHTEFQCDSRTCIPLIWVCDGEWDCTGGEDEIHCERVHSCTKKEFECHMNGTCINLEDVCNGRIDCPDGSDESACTTKHKLPNITFAGNTTTLVPTNPFLYNHTVCSGSKFMCKNKKCIPKIWRCDMDNDCGDNSDEIDCGASLTTTVSPIITSISPKYVVCNHTEFQCDSRTCILLIWVCDGEWDCTGGEDEIHCERVHNCTEKEFECRMNGTCINLEDVCNGRIDCPDGSDESACTTKHKLPSVTVARNTTKLLPTNPFLYIISQNATAENNSSESASAVFSAINTNNTVYRNGSFDYYHNE